MKSNSQDGSSFPSTTPSGLVLPRRRFLALATAGAAAGALGFPHIVRAKSRSFAFMHGVASGDPLPDRVIIWTRLTPEPAALPGTGLGKKKEQVHWQVALDPLFRRVVKKGHVETGPLNDFTVKVDVSGLAPQTTYYFQFRFKNEDSAIGRMRTAPAAGAAVSSLRFGLASCSNYEGGYFSAYRYLSQRDDLDFVLHVGDYIYEYEPGAYGPGAAIGRVHSPANEILSLADYRQRHAQYKLDPDLQALHAAHPFICTWDDHEVTNDTWKAGAENHQPTEGNFFARRSRAFQAYFEWMPIRLPDPIAAPTRIYRQFSFGNLADLSMLDLRQYRDLQPANGLDPAKNDPAREIVGREQLDWLKENLGASSRRWKLVGNSVMISPVDFRFANPGVPPQALQQLGLMLGVPFNVDSWDGYTDDRRELLEHLYTNTINNVAFLTGDIHSSWACNVPIGAGSAPSAAIEMVGTSITSDNLNEILGAPPRTASVQVEQIFQATNPHIRYLEFDSHGYSIVDVTPERLQTDWYYISDRADSEATQQFARSFLSVAGTNVVTPAAGPLGPRV